METINIILIIVLIIIFVLYFFQYKFLSKVNNELTILQKDNPDKLTIEDILLNKSPTVFTGMIENWEVDDDNKITKLEYDKNTSIFNIPLCLAKKYKNFIMPEGKQTNIIKERNTRHFLFLLEGEVSLFLFNPNQNIELNKSFISEKNFFQDPEEFKDIQYLEIKFSEGQIIYIPKGWHYCYKVNLYTEILSMSCESIFSLPFTQLIK